MTSIGLRWRKNLLWLRHSYQFRWAHKPLCDRFHKDVLTIGKTHICRSCTLLYTGLVLAIPFSLLIDPNVLLWSFIPSIIVVVTGSFPLWYKKLPRGIRDILRFTLGAVITVNMVLLAHNPYVAIPGLAVLIAFRLYYVKKRGFRKSHACDGCAELGCEGVCSGFKFQAEKIRVYEAKATELLYGNQELPPSILTKNK